jgi:hypothetical protein
MDTFHTYFLDWRPIPGGYRLDVSYAMIFATLFCITFLILMLVVARKVFRKKLKN